MCAECEESMSACFVCFNRLGRLSQCYSPAHWLLPLETETHVRKRAGSSAGVQEAPVLCTAAAAAGGLPGRSVCLDLR